MHELRCKLSNVIQIDGIRSTSDRYMISMLPYIEWKLTDAMVRRSTIDWWVICTNLSDGNRNMQINNLIFVF